MRSHQLPQLSIRGFAALNLVSTSDTITKTMIAVLTLVAAAIVVVGLVRAWSGRRQAQLVIEDVVPIEGIPSSSPPGLSVQLRQKVRQALLQQSPAARESVDRTLKEDIKGRLLRASGSVQVSAITTGLRSATEDSLKMLTAGVQAVAPKEAEGLLAALSAALPAQRGWAIRVLPVLRGTQSETAVGMAVELAQLGHPPVAATTFWFTSDPTQPAEPDQTHDADVGAALFRLVDPTALWIATRLVSRQLALSGAPLRSRLLARGKLGQELEGLQIQLAGQLALYAMRRQPEFDQDFAQQAFDDLDHSARLLPEYFMPHSIRGAVHVGLGWSYRHRGEMPKAADEFTKAVDNYNTAAQMLKNTLDADPKMLAIALERVNVWRAKCQLLSGNQGQLVDARPELAELSHMKGTEPEDLYNGACLFAVAMSCPDMSPAEKRLFTGYAWLLLGRALVTGGPRSPWKRAMTDEELEAMDEQQRQCFVDQLKARSAKETKLDEKKAPSLVIDSMVAVGIDPPWEEAVTAYRDAAVIFRKVGDRHGEGNAMNNLGLSLVKVRRFEEAIAAHQDAAVIFREVGDRHREGMALGNLGLALVEVRRFEEAIAAHQDAAAIYRETGDRHSEDAALNNIEIARAAQEA
jgi:tetratricopeptide (TPR) repeat protein